MKGRPKGSKDGVQNKLKFICDTCGIEFQDYPSRIRRLCSRNCFNEFIKKCNKNKIRSTEQKKRMSLSKKGHFVSLKTRKKISNKLMGHPAPISSFRKGHIPWILGKKHSEMSCKKMSIYRKGRTGKKASNWKGGRTPKNLAIRMTSEYKEWRRKVFIRDNFTCVECRVVGGDLQAHHIKSFSNYPELRFVVDNGISLCKRCHKKTDNYLTNKKENYNAPTTKNK